MWMGLLWRVDDHLSVSRAIRIKEVVQSLKLCAVNIPWLLIATIYSPLLSLNIAICD